MALGGEPTVGVAYFIILDNPQPGFDPFMDGKALARDSRRLARVARALGLRTLDDYASCSPADARALMEDLGGEPGDIDLPSEQWYGPDEGLAWAAAVMEHLAANPAAVKDVAAVLDDLRALVDVLAKAKAAGARWHLQIDF
jgi:hypothetical protein